MALWSVRHGDGYCAARCAEDPCGSDAVRCLCGFHVIMPWGTEPGVGIVDCPSCLRVLRKQTGNGLTDPQIRLLERVARFGKVPVHGAANVPARKLVELALAFWTYDGDLSALALTPEGKDVARCFK